ncbi:choice-of-anchor J domain-containing protein, partial [Bacteroidales bacterium AH-315-I05]|nr:choice-of-anchor J domain-containing protein [Bacteroidales bacterium AH-315-I05]
MKKVYLIATSMILSGMLPAQSVNQPIDATGKSSTNQLVGQTPTKRFKYNPPANQVASSIKNNKSFNNNQQKAPPAIIFSEDFQNGIPGTWTIIDNDGLTPNTSVSQFTNAWIGAEDFDNAADTVAMSTSWYTPAGQSDDWLITPAITLTTNNVLAWEAEAQDPAFPDGYEVRISTVGPTIADFLANTALFSIAAESGGVWTQRTVDLQAAGYSNQTVYIAWRNNSNDQFILMVDDISVGDQAQFDAAIDAVPMHQYAEYSLIPLSQVETYTFTADLKNNGVQTVTNATLNVSVNQAFVGNVYTGASTPIASLASGVIQTASVTTPFTPADTGVYTIDYIVSITETDGNTTNDTMTETLMVIDSIFSRDDGVVSGSLGIGPGTPGTLGQVFELKNPDTLTSVSFYITNNNDVMVGQSISVSIYDVNGPPNTIIGSTDTFTVTATGAQFITLSISGGPLPLSADTFYLGVEEADSNVTLGTSANIFLQNVTWLDFPGSPTGTWANNEDFAFNVIYVLRANFGPVPSTCDITLNSITGTDVLCTNDNTGSATVSVSGTSTPYTYAWSNGATGATASNLVAGNYTVTVTDASACTVDTSVTITQPASALSVTTSSTNETSFGANDGTATATPSGGTSPYSYSWSNAATTQTISGLTPGTYTVTITDANGCTASGSTVVNSFVCNLTVTITATDETSVGGNDGAATATPAGGTSPYTYDWSTTGTTQTISGLAPGTYSVTVTDNSGCTTNGSVVVNSFICNLTITVSATDETGAGNDDGTTTATPSGGSSPYTYLWDDSNNQTTATATGLAAGTYNVTVTDASGCTATGSAIVNASGCAMTATAAESSAINCNGGTDGAAMATPAGGTSPYTYMWNDVNNQTGQTATGLGAGTYNVTVTDFLNCTATASVTLNEPTALTASVTGTDETSAGANDGTATATASGGTTIYSYLWSNSATTASISGLAPGSYSVTVTDANGCTVTGSVAVNAAGCLLTVSVSGTDETSAGAGDGTATATPSNGTSPYTYTWDDANSQTTQIATGLIPNTYNVTVTDANGCTASGSVIINAAGCNITVSVTGTDESSVGANDGTATANASSGTQPYTYSWSNGNTTQTITGLAPGTYTVTVTDNAGCSVSGSVTISAFNCPPITLTTSSTDESAAGANDGTASVTASGGSTPYSYIWSNGQTDQTATGLSAGAYCVTVADANNCTATACDSVNTGAGCNVTVTISTTDETTAGANDGIAAASVAGGTTPYTYLWSNGGTSAIISGLAPGTYTVTVTDAS